MCAVYVVASRKWRTIRHFGPSRHRQCEHPLPVTLRTVAVQAKFVGYSGEIRQTRARLKLTQAQFAAKIGTSATTLGRWERGETIPQRRFHGAIEELVAEATPTAARDRLSVVGERTSVHPDSHARSARQDRVFEALCRGIEAGHVTGRDWLVAAERLAGMAKLPWESSSSD
jgi:DNA-binding XRE family transcriptional regulator